MTFANKTLQVVETSSLSLERQIPIKNHEITTFEKLITKREEWLNKPSNQARSTYNVVRSDTRAMREKLAEMREELECLKSIA